MKTRRWLLLSMLVAAIATAALPAQGEDSRVTPDGLLVARGTVLMPDGSPAAGVVVSDVETFQRIPNTATTDADGKFTLASVFGYSCNLHAQTKDGQLQAVLRVSPLEARARFARPVELKLAPAESREVLVTAGDRPIAGATVAAEGMASFNLATTDERGMAVVRLPAGATLQSLAAWHPEHGMAGVRDYDLGLRDAKFSLKLHAPKPYTIRVVDHLGEPVSDVQLSVSALAGQGNGEWIVPCHVPAANLTTNARGEAVAHWVPRDDLKFVGVDLLSTAWKIDNVDGAKVGEGVTTVQVRRKRPVSGRIVLPAQVEAAGMLIRGYGFGPSHHSDIPATRAAADGSFVLSASSDHGYVVGILDQQWAADLWSGVIMKDDATPPPVLELTAYRATPLTIRVTRGPNHEPAVGAVVELDQQLHFSFTHASGRSVNAVGSIGAWIALDDQGQATTGVGRGEHSARVKHQKWDEEKTFKVNGNDEISVAFHRPWLSDRKIVGSLLRDGVAYKPDASMVLKAAIVHERFMAKETPATMNAGGTFEIEADAPDVAVFALDAKQGLAGFLKVGANDARVAVELTPTATYSGVLVDASGQPQADKEVQMFVGDQLIFPATQKLTTDAQGRFRFEGLAANTKLQFRATEVQQGKSKMLSAETRSFLPGELRDDRIVTKKWYSGDEMPIAPPRNTRPVVDQLTRMRRDIRLAPMHGLVVLSGEASVEADDKAIFALVDKILDTMRMPEVLSFQPVIVEAVAAKARGNEAALADFASQTPAAGNIALVAVGPQGELLGSLQLPAGPSGDALQRARAFLTEHAPAKRDAKQLLADARAEAERTDRRLWIIEGGPRCGPCFSLARWMDDQHALLEKDYVIVKLLDGLDVGSFEFFQPLRDPHNGVPWFYIAEPDMTLLVTSEATVGNIGHPDSVEGRRHLREMLDRTARKLTVEDRERLIQSLEQR